MKIWNLSNVKKISPTIGMAIDINTKAPVTAHVALLLNFQLHMWLANHHQENTIVHLDS